MVLPLWSTLRSSILPLYLMPIFVVPFVRSLARSWLVGCMPLPVPPILHSTPCHRRAALCYATLVCLSVSPRRGPPPPTQPAPPCSAAAPDMLEVGATQEIRTNSFMAATDAVFIGGLTSIRRVGLRRGARWRRRHRRWSACTAQRRRHRRCRPSCLDVSDDRACVRHRSPPGNAAQAHLSGPTRSEAALGWFQPPRLSCPLGKATGGSLIHSLSPP